VLKPDLTKAFVTNEELLRERVAKLEMQMAHLSEKLDDTHQKVGEMHAILLQAKGARWVIVGLAGVAGLASGWWPRSCRGRVRGRSDVLDR
jgi:hypothetical protein